MSEEMQARLDVGKGDALYAVETPDGHLATPCDTDFGDKMAKAEDVMQRYRGALHALAR